jgi:hypothetical protein
MILSQRDIRLEPVRAEPVEALRERFDKLGMNGGRRAAYTLS